MAKNTLPVNFKDDIMNSAMGGKRRYRIINNSDKTISLEDVTLYDQIGDNYGAGQVNATNQAVNESADKNKVIQDIETIRNVTEDGYMAGALALKQVDDSLVASDNLKFQFATDGEGNYGYLGADDSFIPFKSVDLIPFSFNVTTDGYYSSAPAVLHADLYGTITIEDETISIDTSVAGYGKSKEFSYTFKNGIEIYAHSVTGATSNVDCELFIKGISPYVRIAGFYQSTGTRTVNKHGYLVKTDLGYAIIYVDA